MVIKFGGNINDRCGNLTKKTEFKSADSPGHHLVVIPNFLIKMVYIYIYITRKDKINKFFKDAGSASLSETIFAGLPKMLNK